MMIKRKLVCVVLAALCCCSLVLGDTEHLRVESKETSEMLSQAEAEVSQTSLLALKSHNKPSKNVAAFPNLNAAMRYQDAQLRFEEARQKRARRSKLYQMRMLHLADAVDRTKVQNERHMEQRIEEQTKALSAISTTQRLDTEMKAVGQQEQVADGYMKELMAAQYQKLRKIYDEEIEETFHRGLDRVRATALARQETDQKLKQMWKDLLSGEADKKREDESLSLDDSITRNSLAGLDTPAKVDVCVGSVCSTPTRLNIRPKSLSDLTSDERDQLKVQLAVAQVKPPAPRVDCECSDACTITFGGIQVPLLQINPSNGGVLNREEACGPLNEANVQNVNKSKLISDDCRECLQFADNFPRCCKDRPVFYNVTTTVDTTHYPKLPIDQDHGFSAIKRAEVLNKPVALESYAHPGLFMTIKNNDTVVIDDSLDKATTYVGKKMAIWGVERGLSDDSLISLGAANYPRSYLRHDGFNVLVSWSKNKLDDQDASFSPTYGLADPTGLSLESSQFRGMYVCYLEEEEVVSLMNPRDEDTKRLCTWHVKTIIVE
eukprot:GILJ01000430.1.p1 GENE.GILJ01000430.1~~GILJ01000430.1.p1  ORF type:complete len:548 (+),score=80.87 GILJ01000430.1:43-1686(+)